MDTTSLQKVSIMEKIKGFVTLMKLRVVELLLVTTVPTMIVAEEGLPSILLILATLLGGTLLSVIHISEPTRPY